MAIYQAKGRVWGLGIASLALGFLGLIFFWWVPFGGVLSLAGLLIGIIGWTLAPPRGETRRWSIVGVLLSAVTLFLNILIATGGFSPDRLPW